MPMILLYTTNRRYLTIVIEGRTIDLHTDITKTRISFVACYRENVAFIKHHLQFTMLPRNHIFRRVLKETHHIT